MSTRKAIVILSGALLIAALLLTRFGTKIPFLKEKEPDPFVRPETRPDRPDRELFDRFQGQNMSQIFAALDHLAVEEAAAERSAAGALLESLPDAPYPFPEESEPRDEKALAEFAKTIENGELGEATLVDKWRYNLASAALGKDLDTLPGELRLITELPVETENFPVKMTRRKTDLAGPLAFGDFDNNGSLEIVSHGGNRMWTFSGGGSLVAVDVLSSNPGGTEVCPADYDGDGDLDLFIARRFGQPNSLLQNDGKGQFLDVTPSSGLLAFSDTACAEWVDFDQDGLLDLAVGNHDHPFELYRQTSAGNFDAVSWELKLWYPMQVEDIESADLNLDGYPDLLLSIGGRPGQVLYALPSAVASNWRFMEMNEPFKLPFDENPVVMHCYDFDNDGDLDLLTGKTTFNSESRMPALLNNKAAPGAGKSHLRLFLNEGDGTLTDVTADSGLGHVDDVRAIVSCDIDNDGFEDVLALTGPLAANRAFWNRGGMRFRDISRESALSYLDAAQRAHALDADGDGATDLLIESQNGTVKWLESESPANGWLDIELSNARPGTRVEVLARDKDWILQRLRRVTGNIPRMTIGLGNVDKVETVEVFPPLSDKPVQRIEKVKPNQRLRIKMQ